VSFGFGFGMASVCGMGGGGGVAKRGLILSEGLVARSKDLIVNKLFQ
jgi:hypothetical protein